MMISDLVTVMERSDAGISWEFTKFSKETETNSVPLHLFLFLHWLTTTGSSHSRESQESVLLLPPYVFAKTDSERERLMGILAHSPPTSSLPPLLNLHLTLSCHHPSSTAPPLLTFLLPRCRTLPKLVNTHL